MGAMFPFPDRREPADARVKPQHRHAAAYCLRWFACPCGHQEQTWNSRDAATPFRVVCPSCGVLSMEHDTSRPDVYAPDHRPRAGQRIWVGLTRERAEQLVADAETACRRELPPDRREAMIRAIYRGGEAAELVVWQRSRAAFA